MLHLLDPKQGIVIDKITVAKGGIDPPASSSTIEKGYDSLEASSKTGDVLKENLVKMASTTNSTQTKSGKEFSALIHAHEQKIKQEILVGSNTHEAEPPAGSQKVLGIKKYPSVGYTRRSPSPSREGPSPSTTKDSRPVQVANASADPIFSDTENSIPKNLALTSTARFHSTMDSNQVSTASNQTATSQTFDPAPFPMSSASMTPPPTHQSASSYEARQSR